MARNALRWIVVALIAASLFLVMAIALARLRPAPGEITPTQVPVDSIALPLDATGAGMQVLDDVSLSLKLAPYPPRANADSTLTLVAIDRSTQAIKPITLTLEVAPLDAVSGRSFAMQPNESGAYVAAGRFFPGAGEWRMRVLVDWGEGDPHSVLIVANAQ